MKNELLRIERSRRGWSQKQLADFAGIGLSTVERAERDRDYPVRVDCVQRLCECLNKSPEQLGLVKLASAQEEEVVTGRDEEVQGVVSGTYTSQKLYTFSDEQVTVFASLLRLGESVMFDPKKRKTLEALLTAVSITMTNPQRLLQPESWQQLLAPETELSNPNDATLQGFVKLIEACWQLSKGNELALVEELLPTTMTKLIPIAQQPSKYQQHAANLTAQGFRLYGILALHRNDLAAREMYYKQAVQYSFLSGDQHLLITSLKGLGDTYYYGNQYMPALQSYQDTLQYTKNVSPLLQAKVYMSLAVANAHLSQQQESFHYLGLAADTFPDRPEADPSFSYAEFDLSQMILWEGITRSQLGQTEQALDTFNRIKQPNMIIPERLRIEIFNQQAKTAIVSGDLEQGAAYVEAGVTGAKTLGSQRRYNEAFGNFKQMCLFWPQEKRVKALGELFYSN